MFHVLFSNITVVFSILFQQILNVSQLLVSPNGRLEILRSSISVLTLDTEAVLDYSWHQISTEGQGNAATLEFPSSGVALTVTISAMPT